MNKKVVHREWFRTVSLGGRKSCPTCHSKLGGGEKVWSWGEYSRAKWYTVQYFCRGCFPDVRERLQQHSWQCRCSFALKGYGMERLPEWLKVD